MVPPKFSKRVGHYYLGRTLGEGTYATVKYGEDIKTGEAVAIKILDKTRLVQDEMVGQIKREIAILKQIKHPNVVDLKEVMASDECIYMVMELVDGGELFDRIVAEGPMNEPQARKILQELLDALHYCHCQGIYHRDLKPENVLLTTGGTAKLSDFGLGALPNSVNTENGKLMTTCGTPNYVAPEVLYKQGYEGAPADVWSLGVVLYVIMAGCLPFDEPSLPALFRAITQAEYETPPWFSPRVCGLLRRMICVDPAQRITVEQLRRDPWVCEGGYEPHGGTMAPLAEAEAQDIFAANSVSQEDIKASQLSLAALDPTQRGLGESSRLNAFILISAAIDLSGMFEQRKDVVTRHTRFTSRAEPSVILSALKAAAEEMEGTAESRGDNRMRMVFPNQKGPIFVTAEVFEVIASTHMVELVRNQGDHLEYYRLYQRLVERGNVIAEETTNSKKAMFEPVAVAKKLTQVSDQSKPSAPGQRMLTRLASDSRGTSTRRSLGFRRNSAS
uniref:non-specific serine/threonine protein kinase n=1 Tax=Tetraselmis sp. GSL018 TaxID=582737 RepID=A0A061S7T9_9CHLO|eukprot:CAMPEP_0177592200 /NCGR_PEP_ID=MMETSP0419_2-20121207/8426_1 /TAXON_ID=582737 /ORGANISM="Tetraselmis sp., Strain GSL018" /LENGTH=502 /DNA_ID=CAMNT_0019083037 /DNA_START=30 /DNA_END=1538 /DNA_ORIENTATION=-